MHRPKLNIKTIFVALLCCVFVLNVTHEVFHTFFEHGSEMHSACAIEDEADDCHRYLVHHIKSDNCDGEHDHFLKSEEKCFTCDYYKGKQKYSFTENSQFTVILNASTYFEALAPTQLKETLSPYYLRGPPSTLS